MDSLFTPSFEYKLIYIFEIRDETHKGLLKIGDTTIQNPLYVTYSIFRSKCANYSEDELTAETEEKLWNETVQQNVFIICKTPMAKSITKRTLVGFKDISPNATYFDDLNNMMRNKSRQFIDRITRPNYWKKKGSGKMKFDVIIGNPPYQLSTGGASAQATPLYDKFVEQAKKLKPRFLTMIIPSRWFAGGMGLNSFRESMLTERKIRHITDYPNAKDCFPGVSLGGGVCYFLWDRDYNGDCEFTNVNNGKATTLTRKLDEFPVFVRYNEAISIIHKVQAVGEESVSSIVSALSPYGIGSAERGNPAKGTHDVTLYSSKGKGYYPKALLKQGREYLDKYHIMMSKVTSEHAGEPSKDGTFKVISKMQVLKPEEICTFSYFLVGNFDTEDEAQNCLEYLATKFARFLLLQAVSSINISKDKFRFVPMQDFTDRSDIDWNKSIKEIDMQLYKKYDLNQDEIDYIESKIKVMD